MAIHELIAELTGTPDASHSFGPASPAADALLVAYIGHAGTSLGHRPFPASSVSGWGLTWTLVEDNTSGTFFGTEIRVEMYVAETTTAPGSDTLDVVWPESCVGFAYLFDATNVDLSGGAVGAIVDTNLFPDTDNQPGGTVPMDPLADSNNFIIGVACGTDADTPETTNSNLVCEGSILNQSTLSAILTTVAGWTFGDVDFIFDWGTDVDAGTCAIASEIKSTATQPADCGEDETPDCYVSLTSQTPNYSMLEGVDENTYLPLWDAGDLVVLFHSINDDVTLTIDDGTWTEAFQFQLSDTSPPAAHDKTTVAAWYKIMDTSNGVMNVVGPGVTVPHSDPDPSLHQNSGTIAMTFSALDAVTFDPVGWYTTPVTAGTPDTVAAINQGAGNDEGTVAVDPPGVTAPASGANMWLTFITSSFAELNSADFPLADMVVVDGVGEGANTLGLNTAIHRTPNLFSGGPVGTSFDPASILVGNPGTLTGGTWWTPDVLSWSMVMVPDCAEAPPEPPAEGTPFGDWIYIDQLETFDVVITEPGGPGEPEPPEPPPEFTGPFDDGFDEGFEFGGAPGPVDYPVSVPVTPSIGAGVAVSAPGGDHFVTIAASTTVTPAIGTSGGGGGGGDAPFLGIWPASPTASVWTNLVASSPGNRILGYRPRGGYGQFDAPMVPSSPPAGVEIYSTNMSPRTGTGSSKTPISLVDWANGVYDTHLLNQIAPMNNLLSAGLRRVIVEIWSECNVQDPLPSSQPEPPDWSTANWEAAFLHTVDLWRDNGLDADVWLGTSVAGTQSNFGQYFTNAMLAVSDFIGYDTYAQAGNFKLLTQRCAKVLAFAQSHSVPVIVCETGVDVGEDYPTWFDDAYTFATTDGVRGLFYTDISNLPKGDYRVDSGQPMHSEFVAFASHTGWEL